MDEPETVNVKSSPTPDNGTDALAAVVLVTARNPGCGPPLVGANSIAAVQLDPGASVAGHVFPTRRKPVDPVNMRLLRLWLAPLLVTTIGVGALIVPTPVVGKTIALGDTPMDSASAPVPLSRMVSGAARDVALTVRTPVVTPIEFGANDTAAEQLAPAYRLAPQEFCEIANGRGTPCPATPTVNPVTVFALVLVMFTVCPRLDCPGLTTPKSNCVGFTVRPD